MLAMLVAAGICALSADSVDLQRAVNETLAGGPATSLDCQRILGDMLGWRAESQSGVVAFGRNVTVKDLPVEPVYSELRNEAPIERHFRVDGQGPEPIRVRAPIEPACEVAEPSDCEYEVYERAAPGLYVRPVEAPRRQDDAVVFDAPRPGRYVVRRVDAYSHPRLEPDPAGTVASRAAPGAKDEWWFRRVHPELITGAVPVILVHGLGAGRWGDFMHWAAFSPEAEAFRDVFQLWDYHHPPEASGAAIGFSSAYPAFSESIAARLNTFIEEATSQGFETGEVVYRFPEGPYLFLAHSLGGVKVRAFMVNFPEQAARVLAVATIACPHNGSPWATPQWTRHTLTRLGISIPAGLPLLIKGLLAEAVLYGYLDIRRQVDLDAGWGNFDADGGYGLPTLEFRAWRAGHGFGTLTLSPRDANRTGARELPGVDDVSFEPPTLLDTYCGGIDEITPIERGGLHLDRFFLYGGYLEEPGDWLGFVDRAAKANGHPGPSAPFANSLQNLGLGAAQLLMGRIATEGDSGAASVYAVGDGFIPLQSQFFLDGKQTEPLYETETVAGWRRPRSPFRLRWDLIREHTLVEPDRLRVFPGWSHLDTVTGRYEPDTGRSALFRQVQADLIGALEASGTAVPEHTEVPGN